MCQSVCVCPAAEHADCAAQGVCSSRPCRTAITVNDPSHPRGEKAWWIHTSNHLKFLTTLSTSHLKCQPKSSTSRFPSPWTERETVSMETTSGSLSFFPPLARAEGSVLSLFPAAAIQRARGVCVCLCVFLSIQSSQYLRCARVYVGEVRVCIKNGWNVSSSLTLNQIPRVSEYGVSIEGAHLCLLISVYVYCCLSWHKV